MLPYLTDDWGNPSSTYRFGAKLKSAIEDARGQVAELIGCKSLREILFTSGGTESNNSAIHSAILSRPEKRHIVTSQVEHSSVLSFCEYLEKYQGYRVTYLPVDREGMLSKDDVESAISTETAVVSLMWANNETGVIFPVETIAETCKKAGVLFHCDAVQIAGKMAMDVLSAGFDFASICAHKIGAAKGCGALYVNRATTFIPFIQGGHQERSRRGGTENIASIVGFGAASELAKVGLLKYEENIRPLRDLLERTILESIPDTELNGHISSRLANTTNILFRGVSSEALLLLLDQAGICASRGSACLMDSRGPSHVIAAMKPNESSDHECIRFSLGHSTTRNDIDFVTREISQAVMALRAACVAS